MPRSLCVHLDYRLAVAQSFERNGFLTQGDLAANLEIALSTVNNFCRGIKVSVSKFEQICEALGLEPREIILPTTNPSEVLPATPSAATPSAPTQFFAYDPFWVGRQQLTHTLNAQLKDSCRLMLITGIAGVGKTALAERLSVELQQSDHPYHLLRENFDNPEQSTDFTSVAARLLEGCGQSVSPEDRTNSQLLARRLIAHLQQTPTLILIDSLEQILQGNERTGWSEFIDENFLSFFKAVLATDRFQSRFILTSQDCPAQIPKVGSRYRNFWQVQPLGGLSDPEQIALFEKTGLTLAAELIRIGKAYEGHPLALRTIIGEIGSCPFYGNVAAYWKRYGSEVEAVEKSIEAATVGNTIGADDKWQLDRFTRALQLNVQKRLEHTFERLEQDARYAYILLCETAVYRCPVPEDWWLSHLEDWQQSETDQIMALEVLRDRYLVEETTQDDELLLKQHNLIRSVSLSHLKQLTFTP